MKSKEQQTLISLVIPTYNEQHNIQPLIDKVNEYMKAYTHEMIFVDDGSSDESLEIIKHFAKLDPKIRYISFSRNFGHQAALRAGMLHAKGAAVISMDADLQHPPKLLPAMVHKWQEGYRVVQTVRSESKGTPLFKKFTSRVFYILLNKLADLDIEKGSADFRLLDRKIVDILNAQQESDIFLRGYIKWMGFRQTSIPYVAENRYSGKSKYSFRKMILFASNGIAQFSIKPLRAAFAFALLAFGVGLMYVVYALWVTFVAHTAIRGWTSLVVLFVFFEGIQFLFIGLIGEYLGRTFMQTKNRPEYFIQETNYPLAKD